MLGNEQRMISEQDVAFYNENGYLVVRDVLSPDEVAELRRVTDEFVEKARAVSAYDEIYDLEDSHSAAEPRVRRIKTPHLWHPAYAAAVRQPNILEVLQRLWGPSIRFDVSKLNLKAAGYAPVEWHQDWAFYPHTNDDLAAVGIMIDDVDADNGPLLVIRLAQERDLRSPRRWRVLRRHGPGAARGRLRRGGGADRPRRLDHDPPRAHARLRHQHLGPAATPAAASVPGRRRLAADGVSAGLRYLPQPAVVWRGHDRAARDARAGAPAAAACGAPGLDLREPARARASRYFQTAEEREPAVGS